MTHYLNDGSSDAPKLSVYLNTDNLFELPKHSIWPELTGDAALERLKEDGFEGVQVGGFVELYNPQILPHCGLGRINVPEEANEVFARSSERGDSCITLHLGWGMESDPALDLLVEATLNASGKHQLPAFIETHRATITQDMWRTVELTKRIPEVRFNADFSHYYCGQEMVYGDFEAKLDFMQPIFDRVGFMHGRIAAPGYMQAPIQNSLDRPLMAVGEPNYLEHFKEMWRRAMAGFKQNAGPGDTLIFTPELLSPSIYYARVFPDADGTLTEESDRYAQALLHRDIARECFRHQNSLAHGRN